MKPKTGGGGEGDLGSATETGIWLLILSYWEEQFLFTSLTQEIVSIIKRVLILKCCVHSYHPFHLTFVDEDLVANLTQDETSRLDLGFEEWDVAGLPWWFLGNLRNNYTPRSNGSTDLQTNQVNFTSEEELFFSFERVTFLVTLEPYITSSKNSHSVLWLLSTICMHVLPKSVSSVLTSLLSAQLPYPAAYSTLRWSDI